MPFQPCQEVELDDFRAVGGVGELEVQGLGVVLRLLEPFACRPVTCLRLDDGDGEVSGVAEPVVRPFLLPPPNSPRVGDDPPVRERVLLVDLVVGPPRRIQLRQYETAAGVGFGLGHD